jgi:alanyl-tRNA synthetase
VAIEDAKKLGAIALFGEKYGDRVRVVQFGDSVEFCGGCHAKSTGCIGLIRIISESSVAAGVRRIEAVTGTGVLKLIAQRDALIAETAAELKAQNPMDIAKRAAQLQGELHGAKRDIDALNSKLASSKLGDILASAKQVGAVKLIATKLSDMQLDAARALADDIKANHADVVAVLAVAAGDKLNFIAVAGKDAVAAGAHAGKLVGAVAAATGGKGGGRPDSAMAGGKEISKIDEALALAETTLASMLK